MKNEVEVSTAPSCDITIYMAGDVSEAKKVCREYCMSVGMCVNISETDYIYTGGEETGVRVGFINYPRFPAEPETWWQHAHALADLLMRRLCQKSFTIVGPDRTEFHSRRMGA